MRSEGWRWSLEPSSRSAIVTIWYGPSVGAGVAPAAVGLADGAGDAPRGVIGPGEPVGRTRKTGALESALGDGEGSGNGVAVGLPRGVGTTSTLGPGGGTGGIGNSVALGLALASAAGLPPASAPGLCAVFGLPLGTDVAPAAG